MNRFIVDHHPDAIARSLCDQHIVKMPLEETQMLSTAVRHYAGDEYADIAGLYRKAHFNHPCTKWARETRGNYTFALKLLEAMLAEYTHRYGKTHKCALLVPVLRLSTKYIPEGSMTKHPQCFGENTHLRDEDEAWPVSAYRKFYQQTKTAFARYERGRAAPEWLQVVMV